ncbi:hypothetical protein L226DRAFT_575198 [Lentinus tigrinus ALCF2SS1-7]|uniref:uncharacterized protein n=1 Tax=Lentinus tigrinus ALCF2SS1-7 TaxID=1328758 RepID=UPI001166181F|nr:hypothetical protein L226DRAFT_575198 [Lentinus tigrinus ALCF2SS1-7]
MSATSVDTAATLAPMLLGTSLSLIPYGISLHQMFIYARVGQRSDGPCIRYLALVATFFDTLEIAFAMHFCYHYLVTNYSNPSALNHTVWSLNISVISGTFVMLFTQIFFLRRVSMIELKHRLVVYAATVFVLIKFGLAISGGTSVRKRLCAKRGARSYPNASHDSSLRLRALNLLRLDDNRPDTVASPHTLWWTFPAQFTVKFYLNTLFSVLNSRKQLDTKEIVLGEDLCIPRAIARANRLTKAERWNVPQLPDKAPPIIDVVVTREVEGDDSGDTIKGATISSHTVLA